LDACIRIASFGAGGVASSGRATASQARSLEFKPQYKISKAFSRTLLT
jgi:hypothetical protein